MATGGYTVSNRVTMRDDFGRFIASLGPAGERTIKDAIEEGARLSRADAPVGHKSDSRGVPLKDSIFTRMVSATSGEWYSISHHAAPIEFGARPHPIYGNPDLSFYWEEAGRRFIPASEFYRQPGLVTVVNHPGNAAQPFLRPARDLIAKRLTQIARKHYGRSG